MEHPLVREARDCLPLPDLSPKRHRRLLREGKMVSRRSHHFHCQFELVKKKTDAHWLKNVVEVTFRRKRQLPGPTSPSGTVNILSLCHGTSWKVGLKALYEGMRPGHSGLFGPGIYYGDIRKALVYVKWHAVPWEVSEDERRRADFLGFTAIAKEAPDIGAVIKARVNIGRTLDSEGHIPEGRGSPLLRGYDSAHGVPGATSTWMGKLEKEEWCVYDPGQVAVDEITFLVRPGVYASSRSGVGKAVEILRSLG